MIYMLIEVKSKEQVGDAERKKINSPIEEVSNK